MAITCQCFSSSRRYSAGESFSCILSPSWLPARMSGGVPANPFVFYAPGLPRLSFLGLRACRFALSDCPGEERQHDRCWQPSTVSIPALLRFGQGVARPDQGLCPVLSCCGKDCVRLALPRSRWPSLAAARPVAGFARQPASRGQAHRLGRFRRSGSCPGDFSEAVLRGERSGFGTAGGGDVLPAGGLESHFALLLCLMFELYHAFKHCQWVSQTILFAERLAGSREDSSPRHPPRASCRSCRIRRGDRPRRQARASVDSSGGAASTACRFRRLARAAMYNRRARKSD